MPKNILVDLNVVLDVVLHRPNYEAARLFLLLSEKQGTKLHASAHEVTTLDYILQKSPLSRQQIVEQLEWFMDYFVIVPTTRRLLKAAILRDWVDFEDAVIEQAALVGRCEYVITGNVKDFTKSLVPALTPEQFLALKS